MRYRAVSREKFIRVSTSTSGALGSDTSSITVQNTGALNQTARTINEYNDTAHSNVFTEQLLRL
jgi:hypothetical protein